LNFSFPTIAFAAVIGVAGCANGPDSTSHAPTEVTVDGNPTPVEAIQQNQLRRKLVAAGVDPDSQQGQILARWMTKFAADPAWPAAMRRNQTDRNALFAAPLGSDDRLRMLGLFKDIATGSAYDCRALMQGADFIAMTKSASPRTVEDVMEIFQIVVDGPTSEHVEEHYSDVTLLDADALLNATPPKHGAKEYPKNPCEMLAFSVDAINALPPDLRGPASFEFLRTLSHRKNMVQMTLDNPYAYFDESFDERRLPEEIRRRLPSDGSRPLPYSRVTFDARWVNKTTPGDDASFKDVFVNRRNNGVVAEMVTSTGWTDYTLSLGLADLRKQTVGTGTSLTRLATLPSDATIATFAHEPASGETVDIILPQPSSNEANSTQCRVEGTVPASKVFQKFRGTAVSLICTQQQKTGLSRRWHTTLLLDYGITWTDWIDDEDGRTTAIVRNVTIDDPVE
jgi:hypothetical protein